MTISEFFYMGGYGAYIWPSYTLALVVLIANFYRAHRHERDLINTIFTQGKTHEN